MRTFLFAVALIVVGAFAGTAHAQSGVGCDGVPNCELQQQSTIGFGDWDTKGWAFYCTGDHPYYWGANFASAYDKWEENNTCFQTTENPYAENVPNKLDVTITNWCLKHEDYSIKIACSTNPPPNFAPSCSSSNPGAPIFKDPGCPASAVKNTCNGTQVTMCLQTWTETCSNPTIDYWCTTDVYLGLTECTGCTPN
jgi:hypothetical protein